MKISTRKTRKLAREHHIGLPEVRSYLFGATSATILVMVGLHVPGEGVRIKTVKKEEQG